MRISAINHVGANEIQGGLTFGDGLDALSYMSTRT